MSEPAVLVERDGHVVTVTLNRPDKRNAFNAEVLCRLCDAWDGIDADDDVRVAILTGADGNFSAGADLDRLVSAMVRGLPPETEYEERIRDDFTLIFKGFLKAHTLTKPLVAAVEGYCHAGGMEILQSCDVRVAGESSSLALTEVCRGLFPMAGSTVRLRRQISYVDAMEILLVGSPVTGRDAERMRLVNYAVADGTALLRARELADAIAANGPVAVKAVKQAVVETEFMPEAEAFEREMAIGLPVFGTEDAKEGPKAFLEKRPANFTGR